MNEGALHGYSMTPNLSVGVEHIDNQHKIWFEKANALFEAGREKRARDYIETMLNFLDEYTNSTSGMKPICKNKLP